MSESSEFVLSKQGKALSVCVSKRTSSLEVCSFLTRRRCKHIATFSVELGLLMSWFQLFPLPGLLLLNSGAGIWNSEKWVYKNLVFPHITTDKERT